MNLNNVHSAYFLGVGGIGMSALARWMHTQGISVSGYDRTPTPLTAQLQEEGIEVFYEESTDRVSELEKIKESVLIVYTPAIPGAHIELDYFRTNGFQLRKRAEVLGDLANQMKTIAVAGTHGKTTTTAMIAHIFKANNLNATAMVGGVLTNYQSNLVISGNPEETGWMIVEADEFDRSFLRLHPEVAIITSIDPDHLDIYGSEVSFSKSFSDFAGQVKQNGQLFIHSKAQEKIEEKETVPATTYGIDNGQIRADNYRVDSSYSFDYVDARGENYPYQLHLPGRHNIENALAAIAVARYSGLHHEEIKSALNTFKGVKRRFEYIIKRNDLIYIDDYAHHPTEINALISSVRELYKHRKITAVFQPHLYSRTRDFYEGFAASLDRADQVFLLDIYPARERPLEGVNSTLILDKMTMIDKHLVTKEQVIDKLRVAQLEVLLTIGAGDIDQLVEPIKQQLT